MRAYKTFPEIVDTVCRQSGKILSWSHYRVLLQVEDEQARVWYEKEAMTQTWSVRTLQRNISSQYYYRMLKTQKSLIKLNKIAIHQMSILEELNTNVLK